MLKSRAQLRAEHHCTTSLLIGKSYFLHRNFPIFQRNFLLMIMVHFQLTQKKNLISLNFVFYWIQSVHCCCLENLWTWLRCSTCSLVFGCWELSHVIFLMLRKKELLAKLIEFTKWQLFSLKMVLGCRFEWKYFEWK